MPLLSFICSCRNKNRSRAPWETEKETEYQSTIMEMRNIIKNQERVIEELMLNILTILNIKIENKEVGEVA